MNGRNLLAMTCSGLALIAAAGCTTRDVPRGSIKDSVAPETPVRSRVAGYVQRAQGMPASGSAVATRTAALDAAPPRPAAVAVEPRVTPEPAPPAARETPPREASLGDTGTLGGTGMGSINGSGALTARMMEQARARIAAGDVVRAREWLMSAMNGSRPEALHELGRTFDPNYLGRIKEPNAEAEPSRARALYEEAVKLGAKGAGDDLAQLLKGQGGAH